MEWYNGFILENPKDWGYQIFINLRKDKYWRIDAAFPEYLNAAYYSDSGMHELPGHTGYLASLRLERFEVLGMLKARRGVNSKASSHKMRNGSAAADSLENAVNANRAIRRRDSKPDLQQTTSFGDVCDHAFGNILSLVD